MRISRVSLPDSSLQRKHSAHHPCEPPTPGASPTKVASDIWPTNKPWGKPSFDLFDRLPCLLCDPSGGPDPSSPRPWVHRAPQAAPWQEILCSQQNMRSVVPVLEFSYFQDLTIRVTAVWNSLNVLTPIAKKTKMIMISKYLCGRNRGWAAVDVDLWAPPGLNP